MPGNAANDEQFVFMEYSGMPGAAFRDGPRDLRLRPVCCFQVEHDQVGEVGSMLVLAAEHEEFVAFVECASVA